MSQRRPLLSEIFPVQLTPVQLTPVQLTPLSDEQYIQRLSRAGWTGGVPLEFIDPVFKTIIADEAFLNFLRHVENKSLSQDQIYALLRPEEDLAILIAIYNAEIVHLGVELQDLQSLNAVTSATASVSKPESGSFRQKYIEAQLGCCANSVDVNSNSAMGLQMPEEFTASLDKYFDQVLADAEREQIWGSNEARLSGSWRF